MKQIDTTFDNTHLELLKIFFKANEMEVTVVEYTSLEDYGFQTMVRLFVDEDADMKLTMLGCRHAGAINMLDDYLIRCGVRPHRLHVSKVQIPIIKEATKLES